MRRIRRRTRRDPATASVMTKLLGETHYEVLERQTPSSGLVLADALEQHGHKRLAEDLSNFLKWLGDYYPGSYRTAPRHWRQLKKNIIQVINQVRQNKTEKSVTYKQIEGGFYKISEAEAYRLARKAGWWDLPKRGYSVDVIIWDGTPDRQKAELSRTPHNNRWGWAVLPR